MHSSRGATGADVMPAAGVARGGNRHRPRLERSGFGAELLQSGLHLAGQTVVLCFHSRRLAGVELLHLTLNLTETLHLRRRSPARPHLSILSCEDPPHALRGMLVKDRHQRAPRLGELDVVLPTVVRRRYDRLLGLFQFLLELLNCDGFLLDVQVPLLHLALQLQRRAANLRGLTCRRVEALVFPFSTVQPVPEVGDLPVLARVFGQRLVHVGVGTLALELPLEILDLLILLAKLGGKGGVMVTTRSLADQFRLMVVKLVDFPGKLGDLLIRCGDFFVLRGHNLLVLLGFLPRQFPVHPEVHTLEFIRLGFRLRRSRSRQRIHLGFVDEQFALTTHGLAQGRPGTLPRRLLSERTLA
eukprot:Hpha_TRINITY_DN15627_c2_g1::TRINITY_DN15627_c2_g1_i1::g.98613::m.98613